MPGPPPKRSDERRRRNDPASGPPIKVDIEGLVDEDPNSLPFLIKQDIVIPQPHSVDESARDEWHPLALEMWESFKRSGQALFWEPSDWMMAKLFCESLSRDLKPQFVGVTAPSDMGPAEPIYERIPLKGASLGAYLKLAGQLMITEGERRRLSIELERTRGDSYGDREPAAVVKITDRRQARLVAAQRAQA